MTKMNDAFSRYHPAVEFLFFSGAIVLGMFIVHPVLSGISLLAALSYHLLLRGRRGLAMVPGMILFIPFIALLNALLVQEGETLLFCWLGGRRVTLEAFVYGLGTGMTFVSVLLWFSCYNVVMTSDKFISLFGKLIPALSLLLCMILRLVPGFKNKADAISGARRCIGKAPSDAERMDKLRSSGDILSVLTSWALENSVITADSMKSRGYGTGERTNFTIYRRDSRDILVFTVLLLMVGLTFSALVSGAVSAEFYPCLSFGRPGPMAAAGTAAYAVFLFIPSFLHIREELTWRILRSKI